MEIEIDQNTPLKAFNHHWKFCVGSAHAIYALRHDYTRQLTQIHRDLGIERVRFHGILDDSMHTLTKATDIIPFPFGSSYTEQSFRQCANAYDNVIRAGMKPFVELSFMPTHLARFGSLKGMFYYRPVVSMPRQMDKWQAYIRAFIRFLINRYGKEETETWFFEIWNEPDIPMVFFYGSQKDYFRLYSATVRAIKSVDGKLMVGGPATSGSKWIGDFLEYCRTSDTPVDFISTHQYAGDPIGGIESRKKGLSLNMDIFAGLKNRKTLSHGNILELYRSFMGVNDAPKTLHQSALIESSKNIKALVGDLPLYYTEWNMCASFSAPCNDTSMQAAYNLHSIIHSQNSIDGSSIWCFSDLFEEFHQFPEEFHGGFGLMTQSGIKKPTYYALQFLNEAGDMYYALDVKGDADIAVFNRENEIHILISLLDFDDADKHVEVSLSIELAVRPREIIANTIDNEHCNPLRAWERLGRPQTPTPTQIEEIKQASSLIDEAVAYQYIENKVMIHTAISSNCIKRIIIKKQEQ